MFFLQSFKFSDPAVNLAIYTTLQFNVSLGLDRRDTERFVHAAENLNVVADVLLHTLAFATSAYHGIAAAAGLGTN